MLQQGLIQGKGARAIAKDLKKYWYGNDPKTGGGATYCMERLMRTELARVQTEAQKQSFIRNGFDMYEFICNKNPTKHGTCDICQGLNGKHFKVEDMIPGENAPPMHPHCRCSTAAWEDDEEYEAWLDYLDNGGTTDEWNETGKKEWAKANKALENSKNGDMIKAGAHYGAYTDKNDPLGKKRNAIAADYYEQVRNRDRTYEIEAVAKNSGFSIEDVDKIFAHVFELEHLFDDGTIHRFFPDYYMQHSWMRLRSGKDIQEHDIILLHHELEEAKIMGTGTDVVYDDAHREVEKTYNYTKALLKYLKDHDA